MTEQTKQPLAIYMDQNVYGHMLDEAPGCWRDSTVGKIISNAEQTGKALVWIGPTHVIETLLATDEIRRRSLALAMIESAGFTRMWHGYDLEILSEFFAFLSSVSPNCLHSRYFLEREFIEQPRTWIAILSLLALGAPTALAPVEDVKRIKLQNRLLHARFAMDPNKWVDQILENAKNWRTTRENIFAEFESMSLEMLEQEIISLSDDVKKLDKKHFDRLNKERNTISAAYGALDVCAGLDFLFESPMSLELTLNTDTLATEWQANQAELGLRPMPKNVISATPERRTYDGVTQVAVIDTAIQSWAHKGPLVPSLSYESLLRELQRRLNDKKLPTSGVIFDSDHVASLRCVNVFYTEDQMLGEIGHILADKVKERTVGKHCPIVVTNANDLAAAIGVEHP